MILNKGNPMQGEAFLLVSLQFVLIVVIADGNQTRVLLRFKEDPFENIGPSFSKLVDHLARGGKAEAIQYVAFISPSVFKVHLSDCFRRPAVKSLTEQFQNEKAAATKEQAFRLADAKYKFGDETIADENGRKRPLRSILP